MTDNNQEEDRTEAFVALTKGTEVGHYIIISKIGAGGMGEVYLAEDTKLKRQVALKFMPMQYINNNDLRERFTREARAVAALSHPNIVTIFEVSDFNNRPFFAMENISGQSLRDAIKKGKLKTTELIDIAMRICEGLQDAHDAGIVHRDIKPGNIVIDNKGRPCLLDFGLAMVAGEDKLTQTGSTLGTVGYMSPEQITGTKVDHRSDIFSVGVILYEMLTGRKPFVGDNDAAIVRAIVDSSPDPVARFKSGMTGELQSIIDKALAKDVSIRYQTASGMLADLKRLNIELSSPKKNRVALWTAVALIAIVGGYLISNFWDGSENALQAEPPVLIVLPFENLGSTEDEYFADGIRDEIGSRLSAVKGLRVISPRSADKYKGLDISIAQIGQETGADYTLEATIRWDKSGEVDRIRITPRLTKTSDNYLMWADNYEQNLVKIFAVQSEIAEQIVTALDLTLVETDKAAPTGAPTTNMEAYNFYLRGLEISSHSFKMSEFEESIRMYDSAIALDPNFALAWAQKSFNHSTFNFFFTTVNPKHHQNEALKAAEKALALSPNLPSAKIAMGTYHNFVKRDYDKALKSLYAAKSEIASNAELSQAIGIVKMRQGKWDEALSLFEEAIEIDPLNDLRYFYITNCLGSVRDYESANKYIDRALVLDPNNVDAAYMKIFISQLQYGTLDYEGDSFQKLFEDAGLARISTFELVSATALGLWRFIIDRIDYKEEIKNVRKLGNVRGAINERQPHRIHLNIAQLYELSGYNDSALVHYDSTRILLQDVIKEGIYEFHAFAELGLANAYLGKKEEAIEAGKTAKELMAVDDCHW